MSAKKSLPILIIFHLKVLGLRQLRSYLKLNLKILGRQAEQRVNPADIACSQHNFGDVMIDYDLLLSEAKKIGVDLGEYGADRFDTYAERLVRWNEHVNLTAIVEPDDIVIKHFIDSLYAMKFVDFKPGQSIADVGTGAGFPGMPLLIANPQLSVQFYRQFGKKNKFYKRCTQ